MAISATIRQEKKKEAKKEEEQAPGWEVELDGLDDLAGYSGGEVAAVAVISAAVGGVAGFMVGRATAPTAAPTPIPPK